MAWKIIFIVLAVIVAILVVLYFVGRKLQKKQDASQVAMENMKQTMSMLIIDKKMMKIKDSGLPQVAIDSTPKYLRWTKIPIVKAKVGARVIVLSADKTVYDILPLKKEVKVDVSGIYISALKSVRGGVVPKPEKKKGIRGWIAGLRDKAAKRAEEGQKAKTNNKK